MADLVVNSAKGRFVQWAEDAQTSAGGEAIVVILFKAAGLPTDSQLRRSKFLTDVTALGAAIADFTNAHRKIITGGTDIVVTTDNVLDKSYFDLADQIWENAGGALNNDLGKLGTFFRKTSATPDTALRCLSFHDYSGPTTGNDLKAPINTIATDT